MALGRIVSLVALLFAVSALAACASHPRSSQLRQVSLGMSQDEVVEVLGEPAAARGSIRNKFDQVIDVWEYSVRMPSEDSAGAVAGKAAATVLTLGMGAIAFANEPRPYWFYFLNGELVQWGEAGDWSKEPDRIYQVDFSRAPALTR